MPGLPRILADTDAMVTALLNLLDNAYKYTGDDKRIALSAYADGADVCFAVQDNGIGLSGRATGKIFERFYQVDRSLARDGSGCGLGLGIVRFIVRSHGGRVDVESKPAVGSKFTITLPGLSGRHDADAGESRQEAVMG